MNTLSRTRNTLIFFLLTITTLAACTQPAEDPKSVADRYWQYLQNGNTAEAKKLVSLNSHKTFTDHNKRIASITRLDNGEAKTFVSTTITTVNPKTNFSHTETFNTVLVLQQGKWKVDVDASEIPPAPSAQEEKLQQLSEELTESMQKNVESIDEAMSQGMQLLNEALRDGSKEMGDSLLHMMNELNARMHESIDKMKKRRQQPSPQPGKPDPDKGEGMI
ncbi:MAG TPA: hypothetical protein ENJ87_04870 [Gammaproteobacteria bacterium]|nr:hypothetical protein [Gammaproteobacteria bacterium]